jgi:predicted flap endonuclease-1-like 5' DNA nuclease
MSDKRDMASKIKSAYDLALERMEADGIDKPRERDLDPATLERISEVRNRTEAKLAELEILNRDQLASTADPTEREKIEEEYATERRRLEEKRDSEIEKLRQEL